MDGPGKRIPSEAAAGSNSAGRASSLLAGRTGSPQCTRVARSRAQAQHWETRQERREPRRPRERVRPTSFIPARADARRPDLYEPHVLAQSSGVVQNSAKSTFSVDTDGSGGKEKVEPKSEVRVYGRGK